MQPREDYNGYKGIKRGVTGLRSHAPSSPVKVYSALTGQLLRIEPATYYEDGLKTRRITHGEAQLQDTAN